MNVFLHLKSEQQELRVHAPQQKVQAFIDFFLACESQATGGAAGPGVTSLTPFEGPEPGHAQNP